MAGVVLASGSVATAFLSASIFTPQVHGSPSPPYRLPPDRPIRKTVHLLIGDTQKELVSHQTTVGKTLAAGGVVLGPRDEVFPDLDQPIWDGMPIFLCRVRTKMVGRDEEIAYRTAFQPTKSRFQRLPVLRRAGRNGVLRKRFEVVYRDGRETEQRLIARRVVRKPVDAIISAPPRYQLASRGYYSGRRVFRMVATAYDPGPGSCGASADGITAIGLRAGHGVVAVDPAVIPMRARLYVEGYGYAVAGDIGGAIKGQRIDLGFHNRGQALRYGRRPVTVWVLD